jgi:hypothetical protein
VLNQRLSHLVDEGVFERVAYNEHPPLRLRPHRTRRDLWPVVVASAVGRPLASPDGPPLQLCTVSAATSQSSSLSAHTGRVVALRRGGSVPPDPGDATKNLRPTRAVTALGRHEVVDAKSVRATAPRP